LFNNPGTSIWEKKEEEPKTGWIVKSRLQQTNPTFFNRSKQPIIHGGNSRWDDMWISQDCSDII